MLKIVDQQGIGSCTVAQLAIRRAEGIGIDLEIAKQLDSQADTQALLKRISGQERQVERLIIDADGKPVGGIAAAKQNVCISVRPGNDLQEAKLLGNFFAYGARKIAGLGRRPGEGSEIIHSGFDVPGDGPRDREIFTQVVKDLRAGLE